MSRNVIPFLSRNFTPFLSRNGEKWHAISEQVFMGAQCSVGAAVHKINKMLETITSTTPRDKERLRNQEVLMRYFMELD